MSIYLELLKLAFNEVDTSYYSFYAFHFSNEQYYIDPESLDRYEQFAERNFAYELYHQYKIIIEAAINKEIFNGLQLNGEITKIGFNDTLVQQNVIIPDLVLHKSQLDVNSENQKFFAEVKVNPGADLEKDIKKLLFAVTAPLNFNEGVLICVNISIDNLQKQVKNYHRISEYTTILKKIFVLHPDLDEYKSFYEIVNS